MLLNKSNQTLFTEKKVSFIMGHPVWVITVSIFTNLAGIMHLVILMQLSGLMLEFSHRYRMLELVDYLWNTNRSYFWFYIGFIFTKLLNFWMLNLSHRLLMLDDLYVFGTGHVHYPSENVRTRFMTSSKKKPTDKRKPKCRRSFWEAKR